MTKISILGVTAVLAMIAATPASADSFAQQEPAAFAASHPNAGRAMAFAPVGPTSA